MPKKIYCSPKALKQDNGNSDKYKRGSNGCWAYTDRDSRALADHTGKSVKMGKQPLKNETRGVFGVFKDMRI